VPGVSFDHLIDWRTDKLLESETPTPMPEAERQAVPGTPMSEVDSHKIFQRELQRLKLALRDAVDLRRQTGAELTIAMTHYPPCDAELRENELTRMFEQAGVQHVVFGHLHSLKAGVRPFGELHGVRYHLTACDYLDFKPICLAEVDDG
jgi:predicted phosphohydrolase